MTCDWRPQAMRIQTWRAGWYRTMASDATAHSRANDFCPLHMTVCKCAHDVLAHAGSADQHECPCVVLASGRRSSLDPPEAFPGSPFFWGLPWIPVHIGVLPGSPAVCGPPLAFLGFASRKEVFSGSPGTKAPSPDPSAGPRAAAWQQKKGRVAAWNQKTS